MSKKILHMVNPPPPIGGVTVSTKNIVNSLSDSPFTAFYKNQDNILKRYHIGHVHASNSIKRLLEIIYLKIKCKKVVFTVHGLYLADKLTNRLSVHLADGVIFLNKDIYSKWRGKSNTKMTVLPSMFKEGFLSSSALQSPAANNDTKKKTIILLYAHSRTFKFGEEVYGIEFAINSILKNRLDLKIIFIDPNSSYKDYIADVRTELDIDYITETVNFTDYLSVVDIYVRPTCMDGASVAVQEALAVGTKVLASDAVERPDGVLTYSFKNNQDFCDKLISGSWPAANKCLTSIDEYLKFLNSL